jgi:hypothetical protein
VNNEEMLLQHDKEINNFLDILETQMEINATLLKRLVALEEKLNGLSNNDAGAIPSCGSPAEAGRNPGAAPSELGSVPSDCPSGDGYPYG